MLNFQILHLSEFVARRRGPPVDARQPPISHASEQSSLKDKAQ